MPGDFPGAFAALRAILRRHAGGMMVEQDTPDTFVVITRAIGPRARPLWFGAVMSRKRAVSYHLMPLYYNPRLVASVPSELARRKQGKTCFNFSRPDPVLFALLDELTRQGRDHWERAGFLDPGPIPPGRFEAALRAAGEDPVALSKLRKRKAAAATSKRNATLAAKARSGGGRGARARSGGAGTVPGRKAAAKSRR